MVDWTRILDKIFGTLPPSAFWIAVEGSVGLWALWALATRRILTRTRERVGGTRRGWGFKRLVSTVGALLIVIVGVFAFISWVDPEIVQRARAAALPFPEPVCARPQSRELIIFFHGWNGDKETFSTFATLICGDPRFDNIEVREINYPTYMTERQLDVTGVTEWILDSFNAKHFSERFQRIAMIAHSMGGLVGREILMDSYLDRLHPMRVGELIEVATPHEGANVAAIAAALDISPELVTDLKQGSRFLSNLRDRWSRTNPRPRTDCYSSPGDLVVSMQSALATCDREHKHAPRWGHSELVRVVSRYDARYELPTYELERYFEADRQRPTSGAQQLLLPTH